MTVERILEIINEEIERKHDLCIIFEDDEQFEGLYKQYLHEWASLNTLRYKIKKEMEGGE